MKKILLFLIIISLIIIYIPVHSQEFGSMPIPQDKPSGPVDEVLAEITVISIKEQFVSSGQISKVRVDKILDYKRYPDAYWGKIESGDEIWARVYSNAEARVEVSSQSSVTNLSTGQQTGLNTLKTIVSLGLVVNKKYFANLKSCFSNPNVGLSCVYEGWSASLYPIDSPPSIIPSQQLPGQNPPTIDAIYPIDSLPSTTPLGQKNLNLPIAGNQYTGLEERWLQIGEDVVLSGLDKIKLTLINIDFCSSIDEEGRCIPLATLMTRAVDGKERKIDLNLGENNVGITFIEANEEMGGRFLMPITYPLTLPEYQSNELEVISMEGNSSVRISRIKTKLGEEEEGSSWEIFVNDSKKELMSISELDSSFVIIVDVDEGIDNEQRSKKEILIETGEMAAIKVVNKMTDQKCDDYQKECNEFGNEVSCLKWKNSCQAPVDQTPCRILISQCDEGDKLACKKYSLTCQIEAVAYTSEDMEIKENKIFMNEQEIKVMPDTASENAIDKLSLNKDVEIELKDTGKPVYEVVGSQEKRILGLFKTAVKVTTTLSAETGEIEKTKRPWWSFLAW